MGALIDIMYKLRKLIRANSGIAAIEFALALPILLVFMVGTIEICRYALLQQKLDKLTFSLGDLVTQNEMMTPAQFAQYAAMAGQMMKPYDFNGTVVFSVLKSYAIPTVPCTGGSGAKINCITYQYPPQPAGTATPLSKIGLKGQLAVIPANSPNPASLPNGYQLAVTQSAVYTEVTYQYVPLLPLTGDVLSWFKRTASGGTRVPDPPIYKTSLLKPRKTLQVFE